MSNVLEVVRTETILGMELRVFGDVENPLFLAKDVATWIEHSNVSAMIQNLEEGSELTKHCLGGQSGVNNFLTEDGVYEVLMTSRKPIAKDFRKGFKEFLKAWRKGEVKVVDNRVQLLADLFSDDKMTVVHAHKELVKMETKPLFEKIEQDKPKVQYHDNVLNPNNLVNITDIAKDLGMSAVGLNAELKKIGVQYKQSGSWKLYSKHQDKIPTHADYKISEYGQQLKWTETGRQWIIGLINENKSKKVK
ncbi:MAG: phage antirepressor [Fusobacteriaceae bacterium]